MLAWFEGYFSRYAAVTEVNMIGVGWNWRPQFGQVGIDQEMVMARIRLIVTRFYDAYARDPKLDAYRVGYRISVRRRYEKYPGTLGRACTCQGGRCRSRLCSRFGLRWFFHRWRGSLCTSRNTQSEYHAGSDNMKSQCNVSPWYVSDWVVSDRDQREKYSAEHS